jgi:beta-galactosidase
MQARTIADSFKGGWAATWESTGGPTMWSGYHSLAVDGGVMTRLLLSYIGAGLKGIGLWTWNFRDIGWEGGEYALIDLLGRPSERAVAAGRIAQALQKHRFELWEARGEPLVGVLYSWENEAVFARLSLGASPQSRASLYSRQPSQARIGLARALLDANIPYELVTERDVRAGLLPRYRALYLPHVLALPRDVLEAIAAYAEGGGRVVADMPLLLYDDHGRLVKSGPGSLVDRLFGAAIADYRNTKNQPQKLGGIALEGQYADLVPTRARVVRTFDPGGGGGAGGRPLAAVVEAATGRGQALILNGALSRMARAPGRRDVQDLLVKTILGDKLRPPFRADGVLAYRRSAPAADHYFFVNDQSARAVTVTAPDRRYARAADAVTGDPIATGASGFKVTVPARSGLWVRAEKR